LNSIQEFSPSKISARIVFSFIF